jgi:transcriptional regulator with XRE-family HTH domain
MSRPVLAGLVGYSSDWLKRIENGQRGISIPALLRLARVLRVDDLSTFIDGDVPMPVSAWEGPQHPAAAAIRDIVQTATFTPSRPVGSPPAVDELAERMGKAWREWHLLPNNHSVTAEALPPLIRDLERATIVLEGIQRRKAHGVLASAYFLAQHLAVDMVEPEVMSVLVDRAARAAQAADDPVSLAFGAWTYGHVLRGIDPDAALTTVADAARELERHLVDEDAVGLYGSLNLHCAISAAHRGQDGIAWRFWDTATETSTRLPDGYFHPATVFGPENVALHGVSIAAELQRHGEAVQRAEHIVPDRVPSRERWGRLFGEMAASNMQRKELAAALHFLRRSYETSPEEAPFSALTRGVTVELVRSAGGI